MFFLKSQNFCREELLRPLRGLRPDSTGENSYYPNLANGAEKKKIKGQVFKQKNAPCVAKWDIFRDTFFIKHHYGNLKTNVLETF